MSHAHRRSRSALYVLALTGLLALALTGCFGTTSGPPIVKLDFEKYPPPNGF